MDILVIQWNRDVIVIHLENGFQNSLRWKARHRRRIGIAYREEREELRENDVTASVLAGIFIPTQMNRN